MTDDDNPYRTPSSCEPAPRVPIVGEPNFDSSSLTTLSLVLVSSILAWIWLAVVMQVVMVGFGFLLNFEVILFAGFSLVTIVFLRRSIQADAALRQH